MNTCRANPDALWKSAACLTQLLLVTMQGSPSIRSTDRENYRRAYSVTATRPGLDGTPYLYTLTLSCPDEEWQAFGEGFRRSQATFRLLPVGKVRPPPTAQQWVVAHWRQLAVHSAAHAEDAFINSAWSLSQFVAQF